MSKFKVGDRVRVTTDEGGGKIGDVATITRFGGTVVGLGRYCFLVGLSGATEGLYESRLELVAPLFKVGDRVRAMADAPRGNVGTIIKDDGVEPSFLIRFDDWADGHGDGGHEWWLYSNEIEAAPLVIKAGRYYKTRDGRKVGPMRAYSDSLNGLHPWIADLDLAYEGNNHSFLFKKSGENYEYRDLDIIAEWPAEPAKPYRANVAAQVDTVADEYGGGAKPKFKVGDRIVAAKSFVGAAKPGDIATVASRGEYWCGICRATLVDVMWDRAPGGHMQNDGGYYPKYFELVTATPAIVALIENGQPLPAKRPYVHPNRASAETEAKRLASKHPGKEFGVYEFVSSAKEAKTYAHEWQRLAASGRKIDAIRELRAMSGLGLATAKRAVEDWLSSEAA